MERIPYCFVQSNTVFLTLFLNFWHGKKWMSMLFMELLFHFQSSFFIYKTALMMAVEQDSSTLCSLLCSSFIDPNLADQNGNTALHLVSTSGNAANAAFLIDDGRTDINARNKRQRTPLHLAALYGHQSIVGLLLSNETCDPNAQDDLVFSFLMEKHLFI